MGDFLFQASGSLEPVGGMVTCRPPKTLPTAVAKARGIVEASTKVKCGGSYHRFLGAYYMHHIRELPVKRTHFDSLGLLADRELLISRIACSLALQERSDLLIGDQFIA